MIQRHAQTYEQEMQVKSEAWLMTTHRRTSSLITGIVSLSCMTTPADYMNILHATQILYLLPSYSLAYTFIRISPT
jgi:hypothetical protein